MVMNRIDEFRSSAQLQIWLILGIMLVGGAVATVFGDDVQWEWSRPFLKDLGPAFFTVGLLGLTVDTFFKRQFARDVFYAAFRYVLPDELKEEIQRIINYKFLCTEARTIIKIEPIADTGLVRLHVSAQKTVKNVTRHTEILPLVFAIDEWGFAEHKSKLETCSFDIGGGPKEYDENPDYNGLGYAIGKTKNGLQVKAGQTVKLIASGSEVHRDNGVFLIFSTVPALNPIVEVRIPDGFKHGCSFGVPGERIIPSMIDAHYRLDGAQFPGQCVQLRWWRPGGTN